MTGRRPPPGAQTERTRFAWRRTVLTATVVALLALRQALLSPSTAARVLVAVTLLLFLLMLVTGHRRVIALGRDNADGSDPVRRLAGRAPVVMTLTTCGLALVGIGLVALD